MSVSHHDKIFALLLKLAGSHGYDVIDCHKCGEPTLSCNNNEYECEECSEAICENCSQSSISKKCPNSKQIEQAQKQNEDDIETNIRVNSILAKFKSFSHRAGFW